MSHERSERRTSGRSRDDARGVEAPRRPGPGHALGRSALLPALLLLPGVLSGQVSEERSYAPEETRGCDFVFAVFAPAHGEPRTVRRCPRAEGGAPLFFASAPVLGLTHLASVTAARAGPRSWRVDARLSEEGARRMGADGSEALGPVGVVLDGRIVSRFVPREGTRSDRMVVLSGVPESEARAIAGRLRTEARRASARRDGGLWRLIWHPRPGGELDSAYRNARERLLRACGGPRSACFRDRHEPRDVVTDSVRAEPRPGAPSRGALAARLRVGVPPGGEVSEASLGYDLVFQPRAGGRETVLHRLGDWGYGIWWYVRAREEEWVPIPGTRGWLNTHVGPIRGEVTSARGDLVTLEEPVTARRGDPDGEEPDVVRLPAGSYLVLRVRAGTAWLRAEQPSDTTCGRGEREPEGGKPTVFAIEIDALFRPDGTARIEPAHPRGC